MYRRKIIVPKRHVIGALSLSTSISSPSPTIYHPSSSHPFSFSTFAPYFLWKSSAKIYSVCIFFTWPHLLRTLEQLDFSFFFMTNSCLSLYWDAGAAKYLKVSSNLHLHEEECLTPLVTCRAVRQSVSSRSFFIPPADIASFGIHLFSTFSLTFHPVEVRNVARILASLCMFVIALEAPIPL